MSSVKSALSFSNLHYMIDKKIIVKDVSIELNCNEIVGLFGPNGAGKTTTFLMMVGIRKAHQGTITLNNHRIEQHPLHARSQLGMAYLPQDSSVFSELTALDNIRAAIEIRKKAPVDTAKVHALAHALLSEFNLIHVKGTMAKNLSGGEKRRLELARLMSREPSFIFLDEPFAGVDPIAISEIREMILKLKAKGIGVMITDHNVKETLSLCDRSYVMCNGEVIANGTPSDIKNNKKVIEMYLGHSFIAQL